MDRLTQDKAGKNPMPVNMHSSTKQSDGLSAKSNSTSQSTSFASKETPALGRYLADRQPYEQIALGIPVERPDMEAEMKEWGRRWEATNEGGK